MTKEEAISLARHSAEENGWAWLEPVVAVQCIMKNDGRLVWEVESSSGYRGCNTWFYIDVETGAIVKSGFAPR